MLIVYWKPDKQSKDDVCVAKRNCLRIQAVGLDGHLQHHLKLVLSTTIFGFGGMCRRRKMSQASTFNLA